MTLSIKKAIVYSSFHYWSEALLLFASFATIQTFNLTSTFRKSHRWSRRKIMWRGSEESCWAQWSQTIPTRDLIQSASSPVFSPASHKLISKVAGCWKMVRGNILKSLLKFQDNNKQLQNTFTLKWIWVSFHWSERIAQWAKHLSVLSSGQLHGCLQLMQHFHVCKTSSVSRKCCRIKVG